MNKNYIILTLSTSLLTTCLYAGTIGSLKSQPEWTWLAALSGGALWENVNRNQTLFLTPEIEKHYEAKKLTNTLTNGEFFLGLQKKLSDQVQSQLGVSLGITRNAKLQGEIWDENDPQFNNHSYQYKIQHQHVALKSRLLIDKGYLLIPYISGSIGIGFNHAHAFNNSPLIPEALPNNNFTNNIKTSLTYSLGAGVQKRLNPNWQLGIGYEFYNWGKSELGQAFGQSINNTLTLNHLYINGLLLNLTYTA